MASHPSHETPPSAKAVKQKLESLQRSGVTHVAKAKPVDAAVSTDQTDTVASVVDSPIKDNTRKDSPVKDRPVNDSTPDTLEIIRDHVAGCTLCDELASTRTQTVFGVGNPAARLCFLGEAPGADEDRQGEPFVGRAGKLLNKIIEACTLSREEVYILNILKCRPPGNRNPTPAESANCKAYLDRQLAMIRPEFICCLGAVAAQNLLQTETTIGKLRGEFHSYQGIRVLCTYHPAYLLRNPAAKRHTWDDMQLLMKEMGIELPGSEG